MTARPFQGCRLSRTLRFYALVSFIFVLPTSAHAAIIINEIAWMGTAASQNDEWIELYNSGADAVDINGFTLTDGSSLSIALTGTVPANGFFLLERTDDDTVPGVSAGLIYTGALANDGRTLTLRRSDNSIEDQVAGGTQWQSIGGDNETKETPQLTPSGWITAAATPGATNATSGSSTEEDEEDEEGVEAAEEEENERDGGKNARVSLVPSARTPALSIGGDVTTHAGRPVTFAASPSGISTMLIKSISYTWNFGDGMTGVGKEVVHSYTYPGTYIVTAHAHFAGYVADARTVITVLPVDLVLQKSDEGALFVHNESLEEMDISGYRIADQGDVFEFPPRSFIHPKGTITLAPKMLGRTSFTNYVSIVKDGTHIASVGEARNTSVAYVLPEAREELSASNATHSPPETNEPYADKETSSVIALGNQVALASAPVTFPPWVTYGGLVVVIMLGLGALYLKGTPS